jgi:cardiolipin synthase
MRLTGDQLTILVTVIAFTIDWVVRIIAIIVIPRNRKPTAGMAWLLAIFFIPFVGIILFLLIGNPKLPKAVRAKQAEVNRYLRETTHGIERVTDQATWHGWFVGLVNLNWRLGSLPMVGGNSAKLHHDYDETIEAMAVMGITTVAECGPGKVLAGLTKRCADGISGLALADAAAIEANLGLE